MATTPAQAPAAPQKPRDNYKALEAQALHKLREQQSLDEEAKRTEILKNIVEARNSAAGTRFQRWRDVSALAVPVFAMLVTAATVVVQTRQFRQTLLQQVKQFDVTDRAQREAHEDTEWREALKTVSFSDRRSSLLGAFAMQGFFNSQRYGFQAREIAGSLLTYTSNVGGFDEILTNMRDKTDASNYTDMTAVGQMLGFAQRAKYRVTGAASDKTAPFLIEDVDEIDPNPQDFEHNPDQQLKVAAWELDTVSQFLRQLWRDDQKHLTPRGEMLTGVVLENGNFDELDFSGTNLSFGILSKASFQNAHFNGAKLKNVFVHDVQLDGADFKDVTVIEGSRWEGSNWWAAKCLPSQMIDYLVRDTGHEVSQEEKSRLIAKCR